MQGGRGDSLAAPKLSFLAPLFSLLAQKSRFIYMSTFALCLKKSQGPLREDLQPDQADHTRRFDPRPIKLAYIYTI